MATQIQAWGNPMETGFRAAEKRLKGVATFFSEVIGPGVITGASDDDPSGIATYSQAGAQFGFSMLWTALFSFPLMVAIQEIAARIGRVTGKGIAGNIRSHYPRSILYGVVSLLLVANILNIGADLGAMGAAVEMLFGINPVPIILGIAVGSILLEVFIPYRSYVPLLQILVFALLSYVFTAFIVNVPWQEALKATVIPSFEFSKDSLMMIVAIFGTTISPYLFFWQSSQEVEEMRMKKGERPLKLEPAKAPAILRKLRWDTLGGMAFSNIITFFIILTTGATLHASGTIHIATAADAAKALEPLAGTYASCLFAIGIIGTGLLAIPVLAGSTAFGLGEALRLPVGLERPARRAKGFYTIIGLSSLLGLCMNFFGIDPIQALIAVAVINGVISVPLMAIMVRMSSDSRVMGSLTISRGLQILGWCATGIVGCASIAFFATW